jgi:hypothetical protein
MIPYIRTGVAVSTGQGNLPLFLRKESRRFRPIWQESYRDQAKEDSGNPLLINYSSPRRSRTTRITNLDDEKQAPVCEADIRVLHTKCKEPPKSTGYGSKSKPVGKAQA